MAGHSGLEDSPEVASHGQPGQGLLQKALTSPRLHRALLSVDVMIPGPCLPGEREVAPRRLCVHSLRHTLGIGEGGVWLLGTPESSLYVLGGSSRTLLNPAQHPDVLTGHLGGPVSQERDSEITAFQIHPSFHLMCPFKQ